MCPSRGKGAPGRSVGSGDRAAVSVCAILATTSSGAVIRRLVVPSLIMERYVGRILVSSVPSEVRSVNMVVKSALPPSGRSLREYGYGRFHRLSQNGPEVVGNRKDG